MERADFSTFFPRVVHILCVADAEVAGRRAYMSSSLWLVHISSLKYPAHLRRGGEGGGGKEREKGW